MDFENDSGDYKAILRMALGLREQLRGSRDDSWDSGNDNENSDDGSEDSWDESGKSTGFTIYFENINKTNTITSLLLPKE